MPENQNPTPQDDSQNPFDLPDDLLEWSKGQCGKTEVPWRHPDVKVIVWHFVAKTYVDEDGEKNDRRRDEMQILAAPDTPEDQVKLGVIESIKAKGREVHELRVEAEIHIRSPHFPGVAQS